MVHCNKKKSKSCEKTQFFCVFDSQGTCQMSISISSFEVTEINVEFSTFLFIKTKNIIMLRKTKTKYKKSKIRN